ncbi:MAG: hypothetical protein AVO35_11750 [Candidatus Aegiribacteria sp. MLS_C]|nr:MAG: hypothetical protein AVO35_11750 [Candidatus Aegiribacteria sp. MLS_C]
MNRIVDTYSAFLSFWEKYGGRSTTEKIDGWEKEYMSAWPELLRKQVGDYEDMGMDWKSVAEDRVFPYLGERLERMSRARALLSVLIDQVHASAEETFARDLDITYVIYAGLGCGAGWLTELEGGTAILLGLEMIVENGWTEEDSLRGLLAHELGHAVHALLRGEPDLSRGKGPLWQLYAEGFAQRCEHMIMESETWHAGLAVNPPDWLDWCEDNRVWLAGKFLQAVAQGEDVRPFFGSWYEIEGRKHCGHYLGHEVILRLERSSDLETIALLDDVDRAVTGVLEEMITEG